MPQSKPRSSPLTSRRAKAARTPKKLAQKVSQRVDRFDLYQRAVQCVEAEIDFVDATFKQIRGRQPTRLREDFCATGNTACEWVRRRTTNSAVGLDIDPVPLAWGQTHNVARLTPSQRDRVELRLGNVLEPHDVLGRFDIILAMNFSYWCFKTRAALKHYFSAAREALADDGILFLDYYGGSDSYKVLTEKRKVPHASKGEPAMTSYRGPFAYHWQQEYFHPISGEMGCRIHFSFPDGSRLRDAFTYSWRLWSVPEIRELLHDAGFKRVVVYWEGDDGKGGGDGNFTPNDQGEACPAYIGYISAER